MAKILIFGEFSEGKVKKGTMELLTAGHKAQIPMDILFIGPGAKGLESQIAAYGVQKCYISETDTLSRYNAENFSKILLESIKQSECTILLASASSLSKDLLPKVAGQLGAGLASDCTELSFSGGQVAARKPLYSGKCTAEVVFENCSLAMVIMRPNQLPVEALTGGSCTPVEIPLGEPSKVSETIEVKGGNIGKVDLVEANVVVSGGRGMQGPEHFALLETLAQELGGAVGASRAVADAGWVPHSLQVGQTGKTVAPSLYIAAGISGAIQHLAGMSGSKVIVAINKDPEAPIFQKATYGIVGDLFEVLPALKAEVANLMKN